MRQFAENIEDALSSDRLNLYIFVELFFADGPVRLWSGLGDFDFLGDTYLGVGVLGQVSTIEESSELIGGNLTLTLQGINTEVLTWVNKAQFRGRSVKLHLMVADEGGQYLSHISNIYHGIMDTIMIDESASAVSVTCEHRLVNLELSKPLRLTHAQQLLRHPGDNGLKGVQGLTHRQLFWGRTAPIVGYDRVRYGGGYKRVPIYADPNAAIAGDGGETVWEDQLG